MELTTKYLVKAAAFNFLLLIGINASPAANKLEKLDDKLNPVDDDFPPPFSMEEAEFCLRSAARRFPPIGDPDYLTSEEQEGIAAALRSTSCATLITRATSRLGMISIPALPPRLFNTTTTPKPGILAIPCIPCPSSSTMTLEQLMTNIFQCAGADQLTCCICVFKSTIKAIFSTSNPTTTTTTPAAARLDLW